MPDESMATPEYRAGAAYISAGLVIAGLLLIAIGFAAI